ncbi:MAG: FxLD family lanthipeptide [Pseudonocardiaceae bacterium]
MTIQTHSVVAKTVVPSTTAVDPEFDLDVSIVESAPVDAELMRSTSDNCGHTCESACVSFQ